MLYRAYYRPYGEVAWQTGTSRTSIGFTGQRLDEGTKLMYFGARYYDPELAHFVSADPTTPDVFNSMDYNRYLYTRGNPIRYVDPLGYGAEDYYVFVQGCLDGNCNRKNVRDWEGYTDHLRNMYNRGGWGLRYHEGHIYWESFDTWAKTHVKYVGVDEMDSAKGAAKIRETIQGITDDGPGVDIHILGHSMGAGAIARYLHDAAQGLGYDSRVKSAVMIDAPIGPGGYAPNLVPGGQAECLTGICDMYSLRKSFEALASKGMKIALVDTPYDWVSHPEFNVPGVTEYHSPHYHKDYENYGCRNCGPDPHNNLNPNGIIIPPQPGQDPWHNWTSRRVADETRDFLSGAWK